MEFFVKAGVNFKQSLQDFVANDNICPVNIRFYGISVGHTVSTSIVTRPICFGTFIFVEKK
jgi:hypothetical protein